MARDCVAVLVAGANAGKHGSCLTLDLTLETGTQTHQRTCETSLFAHHQNCTATGLHTHRRHHCSTLSMGRTKRHRGVAQRPIDRRLPQACSACCHPNVPQFHCPATVLAHAHTHINRGNREAPRSKTHLLSFTRATETPQAGRPSVPSAVCNRPVHTQYSSRYSVPRTSYHISLGYPARAHHHPHISTDRGGLGHDRGPCWRWLPFDFRASHGWMATRLPGCPDFMYDYPCSIWAPSQLHRCL